ncbi:hypothetical protein, partial [uncultured Croceitalea sp.]|uniref:hypothetical protein n=1 Tax=uncultured Croceitalea sp. TaxID=1798908 RepID=UPI003305C055
MTIKKVHYIFLFTILFFWVTNMFSQLGGGYTISGPSSAYVGDTETYTLNGPTSNVFNTNWNTTSSYGYISSSTPINCTVTFNNAGTTGVFAVVQDNLGNFYLVSKNNITVSAEFLPGSISGAQTICYGGNPGTLSNSASASGGAGGYAYQWQYSTTGFGGWTNIGSATSTSYNPPSGLTASRWYRRRAISGGVTKYTNSVKVTVYSNLVAGSI